MKKRKFFIYIPCSGYATVAMNSIYFKQSVKLGDALSIYCIPEKIGNTSITLDIKSYLTTIKV